MLDTEIAMYRYVYTEKTVFKQQIAKRAWIDMFVKLSMIKLICLVKLLQGSVIDSPLHKGFSLMFEYHDESLSHFYQVPSKLTNEHY